jgi:hypothetical protein
MAAILAHRDVVPLLSDEHFSVDGTLVKAWASMKASQRRLTIPRPLTTPMTRPTRQSRNADVDFRGEKRSSATHASTSDPDARLSRNSPAPAACSASWVKP